MIGCGQNANKAGLDLAVLVGVADGNDEFVWSKVGRFHNDVSIADAGVGIYDNGFFNARSVFNNDKWEWGAENFSNRPMIRWWLIGWTEVF